tara:strand:- start:17919 stop:18074 length:156 start_codon:yes stop_codon:yes gene_type:complete
MNRKKKTESILKKRRKKANAKLAPKNKSAYISKADREALSQEEQASPDQPE